MTHWSRGRIALLYIASLLPGLYASAKSIKHYVGNRSAEVMYLPELYNWVTWHRSPKIALFAEYITLTVLLGLLVSAAIIVGRRSSTEVSLTRASRLALWVYLLLCFSLPLLNRTYNSPLNSFLWWILVGALPVLEVSSWIRARQGSAYASARMYAAYPGICGLLLGGLLALLYATAWSPSLRFGNDYTGLPEYTHMSNGRWVENNSFLQQSGVLGHAELDPCNKVITNTLCLDMPRTVFRSPREAFGFFPSGSGLHYSWDQEKLRTYRSLTIEECLLITALLRSSRGACNERRVLDPSNSRTDISRYGLELAEFNQKNQSSLDAQAYLGRFFYHHAYLYLPVLQMISGAASDTAALPAQYGVGLTASIARLLQWHGSHAFQDYFRLYWVGPGLYVVLGALVVLALTRRASLAVATAALIIGLLSDLSSVLIMAPGFNPWRHLPDLLCFLFIGLHAMRPSVVTVLLRAGSIALLLWWNLEFGIFMLAGSTAWHLLTVMQAPARLSGVAAQVFAEFMGCGLVLLSLIGGSGTKDSFVYSLLGLERPLQFWDAVVVFSIEWLLLIGFAAWARFRPVQQTPSPELEVAGVGLCYAAFSGIHPILNPSPGHLSMVLVCASVPIMFLTKWGIETGEASVGISQRWMHAYLAISLSTFTLVTSSVAALSTEYLFVTMFQDHRVFQWEFPGIKGRTTVDAAPIDEALNLLQKEQPRGGIILISRYDVLLQTASGRLSKLPYIDLPSAVISWPEIDAISTRINAAKAPVIFMDHDIFANREWQLLSQPLPIPVDHETFSISSINTFMFNKKLRRVLPPDTTLRQKRVITPIYHRVGHLAALSLLAQQVSACYEPGPIGGVLQAWYRRCQE